MQLTSLQNSLGKFTIAAFDHRSSLAETMGIQLSTEVGKEQFIELKQLFLQTFAPMSSAILTDPLYGRHTLADYNYQAGVLLSLEESGYEGGKEVVPPMLDDWGVEGVAGYGAAAKLLLYFHPREKNADAKVDLVKDLFEQTREHHTPFLVEPVLFAIEDEAEFKHHWQDLQQEAVELLDEYCDVLKIEYPGLHLDSVEDQQLACESITQRASVPWILLSRGMKYEPFVEALEISMRFGAHGFAVGRAVWQEIEQFSLDKTGDWDISYAKIEEFLNTTGKDRMQHLIDLVNRF